MLLSPMPAFGGRSLDINMMTRRVAHNAARNAVRRRWPAACRHDDEAAISILLSKGDGHRLGRSVFAALEYQ